jgi:GcrA cell cycle regulator
MEWTDKMLATLRRMWPEGHFCSVIAKEVGGVSASAVAGKAHRLGLPARGSPIKSNDPGIQARREETKRATIIARRAAKPPTPSPQPPGGPRTAVRFEPVVRPPPPPRTCSWPLGEPGTASFRFCGKPSDPGRSYCADHCRLAYVKIKDRRETAL